MFLLFSNALDLIVFRQHRFGLYYLYVNKITPKKQLQKAHRSFIGLRINKKREKRIVSKYYAIVKINPSL